MDELTIVCATLAVLGTVPGSWSRAGVCWLVWG